MYLTQSIIEGLKILGFDKETIRKVSREKSLEEIFLSTLFMNYLIVLIVFLLTLGMGGITIEGRELNMPVFFGLLMIYPFAYNVIVYALYGLFGLIAELLNKHNKVKPLLSVGFHTAIAYSILIYIIAILSTYDPVYSMFLLALFIIYFLLTMFLAITTIYNFSGAQAIIVLLVPLLIISIILFILISTIGLGQVIGLFLN
jgi:hypothetical protein